MLDLIQPPVKPTKKGAGGRSEATNLSVTVRRLLHWAVERDLIDGDPTLKVRKPLLHKGERDRVLDDDAIIKFWHGCDALGYPFGPLFQLLLLTGQRVRKVGKLSWSELDLDPDKRIWHLPKEPAKNGKAHTSI